MNKKEVLKHARELGIKLVDETAFRDPQAGLEELTQQRDRLNMLKSIETQLVALKRRKVELEVGCIAADVALKTTSYTPASSLDTASAVEIADALDKSREISLALKSPGPGQQGPVGGGSGERERLLAGRDALISWIEAPKSDQSSPILKFAYALVMLASLVVIWAAIFVHPILLVVLIGLGVVLTFLRSAEQNSSWSRLGAKRHFEGTGLTSPDSWKEAAVRNRLADIELEIQENLNRAKVIAKSEEPEHVEEGRLVEELVTTTERLDRLLGEAGLEADQLDPQLEQWFELVARADKAKNELNQMITKLKRLTEKKDVIQDTLFRFLARQGEAPKDGSSDLDSLSEGLDRIAAQWAGKSE